MEKENAIILKQKPIIEHQLKVIGNEVTERLNSLNIDNMIATLDSVKSLKDLRAELNKELSDYEFQRKFIKSAILNPYEAFEEIYKNEISEKYKSAIDKLKDKISFVETEIKEEKEENLKAYFIELCISENLDFILFPMLNLDINLSTTEKAYKEKINSFVEKVKDDLSLIETQEFKAEILAEYKLTLNISKSIQDVRDRKEREKTEKERIVQIELNSRINKLEKIGMFFDEMTKTYSFNDSIYISEQSLKELEKSDFLIKLVEIEEKIKALAPQKIEEKEEIKTPVQTTILHPPKIEEKEEIVNAKFQVFGTMKQLKALGLYMKENKITYKNL